MAIYSVTVADGERVSDSASIGGGLVAAVHLPTGSENVTFQLQYSPDEGTTWDPCTDEAGNIVTLTYVSGGALHQVNPPVRAPLVRLYGVTGNETGDLVCEIHTV